MSDARLPAVPMATVSDGNTAGSRMAEAPLKIICFLFDSNTGGPHIRARAVYERMIAQGHSVRVAFPQAEGSGPDYIAEKGIPVDRLAMAKPALPHKTLGLSKVCRRISCRFVAHGSLP